MAEELGELADHLVLARSRQARACQIETVGAHPGSALRERRVVPAQPLDELGHVGVAPHPGREAPEVGERFPGIDIAARAAHIAVDAGGIGLVRLDRDGPETALLDQSLRDLGALA
jgi:hypothetical protein